MCCDEINMIQEGVGIGAKRSIRNSMRVIWNTLGGFRCLTE
jgi:hypothetical protein